VARPVFVHQQNDTTFAGHGAGEVLWSDTLSGTVVLAAGSMNFSAVATATGDVQARARTDSYKLQTWNFYIWQQHRQQQHSKLQHSMCFV
jgi:hypothetical protein